MFVQVIQGRAQDPSAVKAAVDRWISELSPSASGWLGSTTGVTDDGRVIMLVRFESEEHAMRNSERTEQGDWWVETAPLFEGEPIFDNSVDVELDQVGDPDAAAFVQVMRGEMRDPERVRELMRQDTEVWRRFRPDILGTVTALHEGGRYTTANYFTSEAEARVGETRELPAELQPAMAELGGLFPGETEYFDLKNPWLHSPS